MARGKFQVWVWRRDNDALPVSWCLEKPVWQLEGEWWHQERLSTCVDGTRFVKWLLGLRSLPKMGTLWLVSVSSPGRSRIVRRVKGGT